MENSTAVDLSHLLKPKIEVSLEHTIAISHLLNLAQSTAQADELLNEFATLIGNLSFVPVKSQVPQGELQEAYNAAFRSLARNLALELEVTYKGKDVEGK